MCAMCVLLVCVCGVGLCCVRGVLVYVCVRFGECVDCWYVCGVVFLCVCVSAVFVECWFCVC